MSGQGKFLCLDAALVPTPAHVEQGKSDSTPLLGKEGSSGAPNASGVKNATLRYDLPTPAVAVRNLVCVADSSMVVLAHC